jgi:hypothetical protein
MEGSWLTTSGGKEVVLSVDGTKAGLFSTSGTVCSGTAGGQAGGRTIRLRCTGDDQKRTTGTVGSVSSTSMQVEWKGFTTETYTKSKGGKLPSQLG